MKILYNTGIYSGGAPLSLLEYIKIAKENNYEVLCIGEYSSLENIYHENNIKTLNVKHFSFPRLFRNFIGLIKYIKIIKLFKPDLIHATSFGIIPSKIIHILYGIPTIYSIAGGDAANILVNDKVLKDDNVIVYSPENKNDLIFSGYNPDKIQIISNRINLEKKYKKISYPSSCNIIDLLLISRLDSDKINSVVYIMDVVDKLSNTHFNLRLTILGNGSLVNEIRTKAKLINKKHTRKIVVIKGHKDNVRDYIINSHIVFGKGRSVIEPILLNRISYVISEDKKMTLSTTATFKNLYNYNFSGRNLKNISTLNDLSKIITKINDNEINLEELEKIRKLTEKYYDVKFVKNKINDIYSSCIRSNTNEGSILKTLKFILFHYVSKTRRLINVNKTGKIV